MKMLFLISALTFVGPNLALASPVRCEAIYYDLKGDTVSSQRPAPSEPTKALARLLFKAVSESSDPYSLSYDVRKLSPGLADFQMEMNSLAKAMLAQTVVTQRAQTMNRWARSEAHALLLYDLMNQAGLEKFKDEIHFLHENNIYFMDSRMSGNSLITYSFEKEGNTADISLLYRPPQIPEDVWLETPESERIEALRKIKIRLKTFTKANQIAPTGLKPDAVGGYSEELSDEFRKGYGWEIAHKKYEISEQRLMQEVRDLSKLFKQNHSFQVHVAFELPRQYQEYDNFIYWYKQVNDYLYLKGLEEGLHGNYLTGVANLTSDLNWGDRIKSWLRIVNTATNTIEESQSKLGAYNSKFFSAGLRAGIYGPASAGNMKIGIELRDSTRSMDLLDLYVHKLSQSIESRLWEKTNLKAIQKQSLRLTSDRRIAKSSISSVVSPEFAKLFAEVEPTVYFGLIRYEDERVYNYQTKTWSSVSPEMQTRIQSARAEYEQDLIALEKELRDLQAKGEKTDKEIIKTAIRMSLSAWGKKARVAELFEGL